MITLSTINIVMWFVLIFSLGIAVGAIVWSYVMANDPKVAKLQDDELIIKRPQDNMVLVQVTPEVMRRLVNFGGDVASPNSTEARSLYPERALRARLPGNPIPTENKV